VTSFQQSDALSPVFGDETKGVYAALMKQLCPLPGQWGLVEIVVGVFTFFFGHQNNIKILVGHLDDERPRSASPSSTASAPLTDDSTKFSGSPKKAPPKVQNVNNPSVSPISTLDP